MVSQAARNKFLRYPETPNTPVGQASSLAENKRPNYSRFKERQTKECHHLYLQTFLKRYANNWLIG
jgi:hypothetical protein